MKLVPTLYAERLEAVVRYRLEVPERDAREPLQEEFDHVIDQATVAALVQGADALLRSAEAAGFEREARRRGSVLYRTLIPPRLREQLKTLAGPLLISTSLYGVPWELLYDDEDFWGIRYAVGKRLILRRPLAFGGGPEQRAHPRALIIGSDPRGDLPFVNAEVERLHTQLERFADTCCVSGPLATFDAVTGYLREGFDLIHYCGHVVADREGGPALLLADETPLVARVIEPTLGGRPLVFLNGCASIRGAKGGESTGAWEERFASVAHGFLFGGALAVVGTLCEVSDQHAASLAAAFYEQVMAPLPVGEALRRARARGRADPTTADSPTWLSFVLYGHPAQALFAAREATPPPAPPQPTAAADREPSAAGATPSEGRYTRRVCAVLLADVTNFSALMGEDDERTARSVDRLRALVAGIVSEMHGQVEPVAGDAFFATFDSVVAAVDAALQIQRRLGTEAIEGRHLQVRIGVHFGDLLLREGAAFGDAINIAARLQALARPGTICISDGVHRHVRRKFDEVFEDLGPQRLKNISDPVHAYLLVPSGAAGPLAGRWRWRTRWLAGAAAVTAVGALTILGARYAGRAGVGERTAPVAPPVRAADGVSTAPSTDEQVVLGVMLFKPLRDDGRTSWMREVLRDGLNTQLSGLSRVKVYSKEFIDFKITREGLTEFEAATQLRIKKMLSGSFGVVGGMLRIETHIVDVATGVLEASYATVGREEEFPDLQNKMAMEVIARLNLPVTEEDRKVLAARKSTNVEALRLLLEAEGGAPPPTPEPPPAPPTPRSGLPRWHASLDGFAPAAAFADTAPDTRTEILAVLEHYRKATEAKELQVLAGIYQEFPPEQQAAQQRYFESVRDLRVAIDNVDVAVVGDEAVVSYTRTDDFADARSGRPIHVAVRLTKVLRRQDGTWKMATGK